MLKVELHAHTADDPVDNIPHSSRDLIDRAAALGYDALAITLHETQLDPAPLSPYAAERGILLIPGVGNRMHHEFEEYRPYQSIEKFRREIGKYVKPDEVARLERYVTIRR